MYIHIYTFSLSLCFLIFFNTHSSTCCPHRCLYITLAALGSDPSSCLVGWLRNGLPISDQVSHDYIAKRKLGIFSK